MLYHCRKLRNYNAKQFSDKAIFFQSVFGKGNILLTYIRLNIFFRSSHFRPKVFGQRDSVNTLFGLKCVHRDGLIVLRSSRNL